MDICTYEWMNRVRINAFLGVVEFSGFVVVLKILFNMGDY